jgi:triosephosphate isomerase
LAVFTHSVYLHDVSAVAQGSPLGVGAQNIFYEETGAFTGELAGCMLREVGADRVLIGHSERRHVFREPDAWMGRKVAAALRHHLLPVLCIGETLEERKGNRTERVLRRQLDAGLDSVEESAARRITIAYEPVWAIGTGEVATPEQADSAHRFIRKWVTNKLGAEAASVIRILYGGSVAPDNAAGLMVLEDVDGLLVGGASLKPDTFIPIIEYDV